MAELEYPPIVPYPFVWFPVEDDNGNPQKVLINKEQIVAIQPVPTNLVSGHSDGSERTWLWLCDLPDWEMPVLVVLPIQKVIDRLQIIPDYAEE